MFSRQIFAENGWISKIPCFFPYDQGGAVCRVCGMLENAHHPESLAPRSSPEGFQPAETLAMMAAQGAIVGNTTSPVPVEQAV